MGKKIKILQICAVDFTVKNLLLPLVNKLAGEGFGVCVMCSDGPEIEGLRAQGHKIKTVSILRKISPLANLISIVKIFKYIREERFDIVHVHTPVASILGRIAAKLAGVPLIIYTAHGFYFHDGMSKWKKELIIAIEKLMGNLFTDIIFTQSGEDRETAIHRRIIAPDKIYRIGNGVDIQKFSMESIESGPVEKRKEFNIGPDARVIGFIGRIVREKGIIELVMAFKDVLREIPGAVLLIIGDQLSSDRDLTAKNEMLALIKEYNLADKIIFAGYRKDIRDMLAMVDVFVLPSHREGMPRSIIEAMAMGRPVVATNIRGCREEVVDGRTGFLVPVANPERLAEAILKILQNKQFAEVMGLEGRDRAISLFDEEKVLSKQVSIIRDWCKTKND